MKTKREELLESSIEMYENTLKDLREKGASEEVIRIVEEELENMKDEFEGKRPSNPVPDFLKSNRFLVRCFDIPEWSVSSLFYDDNKLYITFLEHEDFCVEKYITDNMHDLEGDVSVDYVNRYGMVVRHDEFEVDGVYEVYVSPIDYKDDDIMKTHVVFHILEHKIFDKNNIDDSTYEEE